MLRKFLQRAICPAVLFLISFTAVAGTDNIAPLASISASSVLNASFSANHVKDGLTGIENKGEWACEGVTTDWGYVRFPWIRLDWDKNYTIDRIVLYDRPSLSEHIASGRLEFSDGTVVWVNQIPNNGTARLVQFSPRAVSWVKFVVTDGKGKDLGFSEIEVFTARTAQSDYVSWVDPYIETNRGRYFYFITGSRPFGMVGAAPHTRNKNQNGGGYNYNENEILGFGQIHTWMISGIEVMPASEAVDPRGGEQTWKSEFSHDDEIVQPGYQRVYLRTPKTWVELTSTERVSFYRFKYTQDMQAQVLVNLGGYMGNSTMADAELKKINNREFRGSFSSVKRYWGGPKDVKVFFVVQFNRDVDALDGWKGKDLLKNIAALQGDEAGVSAKYNVKAGDEIKMKVALSYTNIANARKNMDTECPGWDFDAVRQDSRKVWNEWLGKIEVEGGAQDQKIKFYTDLWHVLLGRQKLDDVSGDYPDRTTGKREGNFTDAIFKVKTLPKTKEGKVKYHMYNSDAFWLSQWNLNILWGLGWPEVQDELSASMIQYADNGGLLPRGPSGGGYSYIMTSNPTANLVAGTYQKGLLTKVDARHAFDVLKRNQMPGGMLGSNTDVEFYIKNGWWKNNAGITIEAAFQDWAVAQMAKKLGRKTDYNYFLKRSESWKNCFNPAQNLLFPKDSLGHFTSNDPLSGAGFIEANAWQATWGVSHDIPGLAKLMGGNDSLCNKLNYAFEKAAPQDFVFAYNDGYVSYANQPGLSNAHVFNYAGKPWLTQYWVRRVREQAYGGTSPDLGYGGHDEDQGQMGALSALMAIGLFNLQGNAAVAPVYEITSPIFDRIRISLDPRYYTGKEFDIITYNNSRENRYIQKATLNGKALNRFWFSHADFAKGGKLEIWLGQEPNKEWGTK
ncbi:GH92 family glycosyl hydrolase [Pedobacter heparinus]|uniref:Alpha-1,2-mannosidase n=1 Tax=Pedobacter heparinus (strain ATCC 13125 / DSM 2366 / CIP 104194 / JCM 7457 / NBRC 12017 / NCIMB 9290 / NRRL B-14731 / HIM 762-3) TaxID=485917 RepID=C6Y1K7_PEDHD|nr:GH92 family glycosyl hydrolase [Pedobacter heparinus]ACU02983.1 alpha-1,2-mannosidase [Pedobacter heparinus DSM 2366]